eukprot:scaffold4341_cov161-Amphora_coffeaeformis.AAC.5
MARTKSTPRQKPRFRPNGWRYMPRYMISQWDELRYAPPLTKEQRRIAPRPISPSRFVSEHVFDVEVVSQATRDEWSARARARRGAAEAEEEKADDDDSGGGKPKADDDNDNDGARPKIRQLIPVPFTSATVFDVEVDEAYYWYKR